MYHLDENNGRVGIQGALSRNGGARGMTYESMAGLRRERARTLPRGPLCACNIAEILQMAGFFSSMLAGDVASA